MDQEEQIQKSQQDEDEQNEPIPPKKRKKVQQHRLKPEMITDPRKGMMFLYDTIKDYTIRGDDFQELDNLMHLMEEWHYQVMPKYDFNYFNDRLHKFGNNNAVKSQLQLMRKAHKGLIPWEFIRNPLGIQQNGVQQPENTEENNQQINEEPEIEQFIPQNEDQPIQQSFLENTTSPKINTTQKKIIIKSKNTQSQVKEQQQQQQQQQSLQNDSEHTQIQQIQQIQQIEQIPPTLQEEDDDIFAQIEEAYKIRDKK